MLLDADTPEAFRDGLAKKLAISSTTRTCKMLARALNFAAEKNRDLFAVRHAWKVGLKALKGGMRARRFIEVDAVLTTRIVHQAYVHDPAFGLFVETHVGGARTSQICRLDVADLQGDRLMMPLSAKGHDRDKFHRRRGMPIPHGLAVKLRQAAAGRPADAPLLVRSNGERWGWGKDARHRIAFREVIAAVGVDPDRVTLYAFRHASIIRMIRKNISLRIVASLHDTSVSQIERHYSAYIHEVTDDIAREGLLSIELPATENVIPLVKP